MAKKKILFLCWQNAVRSQLAEGLMRKLFGERYEVFSAGIEPKEIHPLVIEVLKEVGISATDQHAKSLKEFEGMDFDYVVTVCDQAKEACPFFPGGRNYLHKNFPHPEEEDIASFRNLREEIRDWLLVTFEN